MAADMDSYNASVEEIREQEFPMLNDDIYLDHAGTTLYSRSLVDRFAADMMATLLGNPHAASASSQAAGRMIDNVRLQTLRFFHADPAEFDLVFVANATAGAKLVTEAFRALPDGFTYAYHQACHTSLVGVREEARSAVCLPSDEVEAWAMGCAPKLDHAGTVNTLFAYPAQSNMDGRRFPLSWAHCLRNQTIHAVYTDGGATHKSHIWTLLDAAAYAATSPLDLSNAAMAPDFTLVSFYKIFGFPDLAGLIVRKPAEVVFDSRRYFGGGTVEMVVCSPREQWHSAKGGYESDGNSKTGYALHDRIEDGTLPVHSIAALGAALETHAEIFGSMRRVAAHTSFLTTRLYDGLAGLRHGNGAPVCRIYSPERHTEKAGGPIVAFNLQNSKNAWAGLVEFDRLATMKKIHLRTGGVCNPGGVAAALGLAPWEVQRNFSHGLRCGSDEGDDDIVAGKPSGIIRVSLGAMSTVADIDRFLAFIKEFYVDDLEDLSIPVSSIPMAADDGLVVASISVYPIKSCAAFKVPPDTRWAVRPEGLAWDREWCLVHRVTRRALSQKQYPNMALLQPELDFESGVLCVSFAGPGVEWIGNRITVPLSHNPAMYASSPTTSSRSRASRVCGEDITAQVYSSETVNDFFSRALGVPCSLARFPPGGQGASMRHAKAHLQKYQRHTILDASDLPSPPDSDSEKASGQATLDDSSGIENATRDSAATRQRRRILLSNESPILAIHMASLRELSEAVRRENGCDYPDIAPSVFRANIVLDCPSGQQGPPQPPYAEDGWLRLRIGQQPFKMLGACRRCHMVCINQETASKSSEPFVTLTKSRRFDGKVFFGAHMVHDPERTPVTEDHANADTPDTQFPTIMVGETVDEHASVQGSILVIPQNLSDPFSPGAPTMEATTLADYQRGVLRTAFRSAVSRGEARPFTLLACFVPTVIVPAVFIAVAGKHRVLRPLRYALAAALLVFQINQLTPLWTTDGTWARISSLNFACAYGVGISISWGTMWALNLLLWSDPWDGERVARRKRKGPPETGPDGIMSPEMAPDEDIARSLSLGQEYYWQSFPADASFLARIDWAFDLCLAWRGVAIWCSTSVL
ncbi:hypothetical protein SEPCBS119000_004192 [Sporothrix epigloea]|uniref:Molybdenum cofactor sulfurase n=1 Tax=Sporothrix epigloea TaxID=1892477 RepID=A0ABP0DTP0_9PEZI